MGGAPARRGDSLLVLGAGPAQLGLLAAARERGLRVVAADRDPAAPGFELADRRALVSAEDEEALARLADAERVGGIVAPGIDWPVGVAARVAERLGLPHPISADAARLATSKLRQRERLAEAGVPQPRWTLLRSPAAVVELEIGPPCVVKAPDRQGQRGLTLVPADATPDDVAAAVDEAIAASRAGAALVEELAPGGEVTVNAFSVDGEFHALTVTDRLTADPPAFGVALAHVWPAAAGADVAAVVAGDAVRALGIQNGPSYTQVRLGEDGPRVIEVAARLGGGHDAELCLAAVGVDLNGLALDAALGRDVAPERIRAVPQTGGACVRFLLAPPGEVHALEGVDAARASAGIRAVHVYRRPGDVVRPLRIGADRAGAVLAVGADAADALARADDAARLVIFT